MSEKVILDIISDIEPQIFLMLVKLLIAGFIAMFIVNWLKNMVEYFRFTTNKFLGIGVRVNVRGKNGKIAWYNTRWILVRTSEGEIAISISRWRIEQWTILNNEKNSEKK